jgi:hypothetical protein
LRQKDTDMTYGPFGLGTTRHELAMARHFLVKTTANGPLQVECAIVSINKAVRAMPNLGRIDELNDDQMLALRTLINHMAETGEDPSECLNIQIFRKYLDARCQLEDAAVDGGEA